MAGGNDLNPCQLVDVEQRFVRTSWKILFQMRKQIRTDNGTLIWTKWTTVPEVNEECLNDEKPSAA